MSEALSSECLWRVFHNGHFAWYQRAFLPGDFKPGRSPLSCYVVDAKGRCADPDVPPSCFHCGEVAPNVDTLEVVHHTGAQGYLNPFRHGGVPWPAPTDPMTCWHCNCTVPVVQGVCQQCLDHLLQVSKMEKNLASEEA